MFSRSARGNVTRALMRYYSESTGQSQGPPSSSSPTVPVTSQVPNVPGLSNAVVHPASQPVGPDVNPNKSGAYKVPEYFCYDNMSFFEAEVEMSEFRLPQPSALKK